MSTPVPSGRPSRVAKCRDCLNQFPIKCTCCPHCGRPQLFPNVSLARDENEKKKLESRYNIVMAECKSRGAGEIAIAFAAACSQTVAVFNCWLLKLHREVASITQVFETYHHLERLRLRESVVDEFDYETLRPQAETDLFGSAEHLDKIHYACLSLDGKGLASYGDCCVQLAEPMIRHRASCFEGNTAVIYRREASLSGSLRSDWEQRNELCFAMLADRIGASTISDEFPGILLECGIRAEDDRFIEVHVFGPMTAKTFLSIRFDATNHGPQEQVLREMIEQKLGDVPFEVITPR